VAPIACEYGFRTPVGVWRRTLNVAGVSIPRSKYIVRVSFIKVALNPRPQAGARAILSPP
jgi:hypothetical protein